MQPIPRRAWIFKGFPYLFLKCCFSVHFQRLTLYTKQRLYTIHSETMLRMGVRKHPAAWTNKSIQNANKCVRCAQCNYIVFTFYKVCKSLFPRPRLARDLSPPLSRWSFPGCLDTIKAGLLFPALVRCLYFLAVWKAEQAYIFRSYCLGDLFQVRRV